MEKIVYLLGAGFSAPLGLPVMANFLEKSKDQYFAHPKEYSYFTDVFDKIKNLHISKTHYETDLLNIEEILSILEMEKQLKGNPSDDTFTKFISDVIKYYTPEFEEDDDPLHTGINGSFPSGIWRYYCRFVAAMLHLTFIGYQEQAVGARYYRLVSSSQRPISYGVITLNYDLVLEKACEYLTQRTGAAKLAFLRAWQPDLLAQGIPHLAKLHGSVDTGDIIPPTWNKFFVREQTLLNWKMARHLLGEANQIRIIGYSLPGTDSYIRYLLKAAVVDAPNLKRIDVICLDRDKEEMVRKRYKAFIIFKNFRFLNMSSQDYLGQFEGQLNSPTQDIVSFEALLERFHEHVMSNAS